jgi:hypothetical protein
MDKRYAKGFSKLYKERREGYHKTINKNQYIHVCSINGKSYSGEVKNYKQPTKK